MLINESYHDVKTSYGTNMRLFIFHPVIPGYPKAKFPGVIVYSEIYQVTGPVSRFAKDIAAQGYVVVAPSIYHNFELHNALPYDAEGTDKGNRYKIEKELRSYDEDNDLAVAYLEGLSTCTGKIGATGMCLGGHLAFRAALNPKVSAAFCFFATDIHNHALGRGQSDDSLARSGEIKGELIMVFGDKDPHVPLEGRDLIRNTLRQNKVQLTFMEVNGAQHAFIRDENLKGRYDAAVTKMCFEWLLDLFHRQLTLDLGQPEGEVKDPENIC